MTRLEKVLTTGTGEELVDFSKLPIVKLPPEEERRFERRLHEALVAEGRSIRRARLPYTYIRDTIDPDMANWVRCGWRYEDADIKERARALKAGMVYANRKNR